MNEIEEMVRDRLRELATYARTGERPGPVAPAEPAAVAVRPRPRRARYGWVAAAACVVALVGATVALVRSNGGDRIVAATGTTERLAPAGIVGRSGAASVWTGREVIVWGGSAYDADAGSRSLADGAALDPSANRWRPLPPAPIGPRSGAVAVWTGREMLVWGGGGGDGTVADGAAFDPRANRWRVIAARPWGGEVLMAAVWTGTEMLVVGPSSTSAYDPAADRWRQLAPSPGALTIPYPQVVWTGREAVATFWPGKIAPPAPDGITAPPTAVAAPAAPEPPTGGTPPPPPPPPVGLPASPPAGPNSNLFLASYSPATDRWSRLPDVALRDHSLPRLVWTGSEILVIEAQGGGVVFDPADAQGTAWRRLPPVPGGRLPDADAMWSGREALFWAGSDAGYALDPAAGTWRTFDAGGLRTRADPVLAWTGDALIGWGGFGNEPSGQGRVEDDGIRYRPPRH